MHNDESSDHKITVYDQNNIVNVIAEVENSSDLIQHYLTPDNVHANS